MSAPDAAALAEFAKRVITEACFEGTDLDGGTAQIWAVELGLLERREATVDDVRHHSDFDVGDEFYFFKPWLLELAKATS